LFSFDKMFKISIIILTKSINNSLASLNTSNLPYSVFLMIIWVSIITYKTPTINPITDARKDAGEMKNEIMHKTKVAMKDPKKMCYNL